jgi:hypothetical protein
MSDALARAAGAALLASQPGRADMVLAQVQFATMWATISIAESLEKLAGTVRLDKEGEPAVLGITKFVERTRGRPNE